MRNDRKFRILFFLLFPLLILQANTVWGSDTSGPTMTCGPGTQWIPSAGECQTIVVCSEGTVNVNNTCVPSSRQPIIEIINNTLPTGNTISPYEASLVAEISNPSTSEVRSPQSENWEVWSGTLPVGLSLESETGIISGNPSVPGIFEFTIRVIGGPPFWITDEKALSIQIGGNLPVELLVPDTGQTTCFALVAPLATCPISGEQFYGQDAQYDTIAMTHEVSEPGIVHDGVNGLEWQAEDDGKQYNWFEASGTNDSDFNPSGTDVCGSLDLGGYSDWRLPTRRELASIIDYGSALPAINTDYFSTSGRYYWTATSVADLGAYPWYVEFNSGSVDFNLPPSTNIGYVRCVRGTSTSEFHDYIDNDDGTVTDVDTGLVWQQYDAGSPLDWETALAYCESLDLANYDDWKLPDVKELESLVDVTRSVPSIDMTYFPGALPNSYWSSTSDMTPPHGAWAIDFSFGQIFWTFGKDDVYANSVRCVRRP